MQERALRFVYEDHSSSYQQLLEKVKIHPLHINRQISMVMETFNIVNELVLVCLHDLLNVKEGGKGLFSCNVINVFYFFI